MSHDTYGWLILICWPQRDQRGIRQTPTWGCRQIVQKLVNRVRAWRSRAKGVCRGW